MLILISPAKTLDYSTPKIQEHTQPDFTSDIKALVQVMKKKSASDIAQLMHISANLAELNEVRYKTFQSEFNFENSKQALLAFKGDVYTKIDVDNYTQEDFAFAQEHLRILSGLYGLLKPLDLIQPYRLEMGTRFANRRGQNLYRFWGDTITDQLNRELGSRREKVLVNLASTEYWQSVNPRKLDADVITPVFKDCKNGQYKIISFFAKKARGMMSAYIIQQQVNNSEALKHFNTAGYAFNESMSSATEWVFTRAEQAA